MEPGVLRLKTGVPEVEPGALRMEAGVPEVETGTLRMKARVPEVEPGTLSMKAGILDLEAGVHQGLKIGHWIHGDLEMIVHGVAGDPELSFLVRSYDYGPMRNARGGKI